MQTDKIILGDALEILKTLENESVDCVITSPPYFGLRDYGVDGQIGLEDTPEAFVQKLVEVFREVRRVLRNDGTLWLNLGDSYNGSGKGGDKEGREGKQSTNRGTIAIKDRLTKLSTLKPKDLIGIPWRVAFALQADGWYLRQDIIWHKPNPMPESVTDRCTKAHEYIFLLSKSPKYYFDSEAVSEAAVTNEHRPHGIVRDREYGYDSKQKVIRAMWKEKANPSTQRKTPIHSPQEADGNMFAGDRRVNFEKQRYTVDYRNRRSVWTVTSKPYKGAHFATFPPDLIVPCILAGVPVGGIVLDPFMGAGTTALVAKKLGRKYLGIELNPEYIKIAEDRINNVPSSLF